MKKEIVFVIPSLDAGGAEKSLVNLLNTIDFDLYNVDLVLLNKSGIFFKMIPSQVVVLDLNYNYRLFSKPFFSSFTSFNYLLKLKLFYNRVAFSLLNNFRKNKDTSEQISWKNLQVSIATLPKNYDAAIGFLEKTSIYFAIDKIKATKKIGWIHTKYSSSGMSAEFDSNYFKKLDALIAVSPDCNEDLQLLFPDIKSKIKTIHNIVSTSVVKKLSDTVIDDSHFLNATNSIVTIARLSLEKGCDLAVEASKIMAEKKTDFKWFIIGDGKEYDNLASKIKQYRLENHVFLLGLKDNPYPYLKYCTLYVQPSRYEGKSMAIDEAKILGKPIIVTNYTTAKDQITTNENGIIAAMNSNDLATSIIKVINDKDLQNKLILNLSKESIGTELEINKLYEIINE